MRIIDITKVDEMSRYFKSATVSFEAKNNRKHQAASLLGWWEDHSKEFPILSAMAKEYLALMPASVSSERSFSIAELTISDTRSRLHPDTAKELLCLKSWFRLME